MHLLRGKNNNQFWRTISLQISMHHENIMIYITDVYYRYVVQTQTMMIITTEHEEMTISYL